MKNKGRRHKAGANGDLNGIGNSKYTPILLLVDAKVFEQLNK